MLNSVLFVSHKEKQCGVYQFGYSIGRALKHSKKYNFIYVECSSLNELNYYIKKHKPICTIYNYQGDTLPWLNGRITFNNKMPEIGIIHEVTQKIADCSSNDFFDFYIASDPTLVLKNPLVYKTGRLLLRSNRVSKTSDIPIIGSFGFGSPNKNFDLLVQNVCDEFEEAIIRLNISFAEFGDKDGNSSKKIVSDCIEIVKKYPSIKLLCSHDFLNEQELLDFLNSNTINVFLYSDDGNRGISSVIDFALSVRVPIAISHNSSMFRHINNTSPSIVISDKNGLKNIIRNGTKPLERYYNEWTEENLVWDYERIVSDVIKKNKYRRVQFYPLRRVKRFLKKYLFIPLTTGINRWSYAVQDYKDTILEYNKTLKFEVADIPDEKLLYNRILNDEARYLYNSSTDALKKIIPNWMERKIDRANIQQGFMLDTIVRLSKNISNPKILCVGCFEDTAYGALQILGYDIFGIDPVLNYELDTYLTKPSVKNKYFDIVFSTSVIEHVEDDLMFLKKMCLLTKKGGYIILTCDFKEGYKIGDPKPNVCYRFYTKEHLNNLLSNIEDCIVLDKPHWDCPNPDFDGGKTMYTFATVVLQKIE